MKAEFSSITDGILFNQSGSMYPSRLIGHCRGSQSFTEDFTHTYGFVHSGRVTITDETGFETPLRPGMYFSIPGRFTVSGEGEAAMFQRVGYRGLAQFGGPIESKGRLCYINNCMNSILISPARVGDPCLNLLSFPGNVEQSMHVHPSIRMGLVIAGEGRCVSTIRPEVPLRPGNVFLLEEAYPHCFHSSPGGLLILAYHPDSDVGPTDQENPMLSRTYRNY